MMQGLTKWIAMGALAATLLSWTSPARSQEAEGEKQGADQAADKVEQHKPAHAYKLDFVLSEIDGGKRTNGRNYSMIVQEDVMNKLRVGARVPISTGAAPNFQYLDIGMNIDCKVKEQDGSLLLYTVTDASNFTKPGALDRNTVASQEVIHQLRAQMSTVVSLGKPTVIATMDDPSSKSQFQLEVTATKVR